VSAPGTVYLVGAGPGEPGLITVRGAELLAVAEVVVYDALVNPRLLDGCPPGVELHYVGKRGGRHTLPQAEINALLVELSGRHSSIVRLKGGDPFVFGRGGDEALALRDAGIPFEVVPGVTAGIAVPAYAGIPVTHRGVASSVAFVTGHEDPAKDATDLDWGHLALGISTLVFFMGMLRMRDNFRSLIEHGRDPSTPAAVIEWGTYPRQRTVSGTLESLPDLVDREGLRPPVVVVVGEVVALRERIAWFEDRPLFGKRVVVTRARAQASGFAARLDAMGAEVVQFPTIRIVPAADEEPLLRAAREADGYDWIVFTSVNGVARFWAAMRAVGRDARALGGVSICAIGPATAAALELEGVRADLVPEKFVAESVLEALRAEGDLTGRRVLLPRAELARSTLPEGLEAAGAEVTDVVAYRTVPDGGEAERFREMLAAGEVDLVTFTASSTVNNFVDLVGTAIGGAVVASIGPITSATARERGLPVHIEASEYTIDGLLDAIRSFFGG
jgi:uroporphyrinogen III methyltransferase / synthase